jgi:iron(III) transport system ATP-binding protein
VVKGKTIGSDRIAFADGMLRCNGAKLVAGKETAVSIRQHDIRLSDSRPQEADNVFSGTIVRQVFLGGSRDYMVEVAGGTQLRVVTSAAENIAQGAAVFIHMPSERCRALER